jgi:peptide chain release factor subunit 1
MASDEEQSEQRARYEFKRILEDLEGVRGRGTELVSLYVTPDKNLNDVRNQISSEIGEAQNIKSKSTRKNVTSALEVIEGALKNYKQTPEDGLVFLVGHKSAKGDTTEMVRHVLEPPQPVPVNLYRCDNTFHLDPLVGMIEDADAYGLVVIDRSEASIGVLRGEHVETLRHTQSMVPSKHTAGGQSQQRFERLIEEAAQTYFRDVAEQVNELLWTRRDKEIQGLLVGGPGHTKDEWLKTGELHHELEKKLVDTFDTGYADEYGLSELVDQAHDTLEQRGLTREKDLVDEFLAEVRQEGGKFSYGEDQVRKRLRMGAVETLLLSESLRRIRADLVCPECEHRFQRTTDEPDQFRPSPAACPECGEEAEIEAETDVVAELTELADQRGTDVELISEQSEQGQMLVNAFGGVAAILRFRIS